jgi:tRNA (guanine26-N2/guanine27-N2)-dimethyltransferase
MAAFFSALLHQGYKVSVSHCQSQSFKTDAPQSLVWDVWREWVKQHPVEKKWLENAHTPASKILLNTNTANTTTNTNNTTNILFAPLHPEAEAPSRRLKLVRYQENPTPYWGPKAKAHKRDRLLE